MTYYQQVLDNDTELSPQQIHKSAVYQQYIKINRMELKVNQELSQTQNTETNEFEVSGTATLYPPVIPNVGDMFVADIGDGRSGIFVITSSERQTILKQACFQVEYQLRSYADEGSAELVDLNEKSIQETHFVKSYLEYGENPVIIEEEYQQQRGLNELYREVVAQFMADFYSRRFETLIVPHQTKVTYDAFVTKTILSVLDTTEQPMVQNIKDLNVNGRPAMDTTTLWNCLLRLSDDYLPMCVRKMYLVGAETFGTFPYYEGIYFSGVEHVVHPDESRSDVDAPYDRRDHKPMGTQLRSGARRSPLGDGVIPPEYRVPSEETGIGRLPDIHPVTHDDHYVFSQGFYSGDLTGGSKLEVLARDALAHRPIDLSVLTHLADTAKTWSSLERFYYMPVLIILMKTNLRELT